METVLSHGGRTAAFNKYEILDIVADLEYKDPWNVHIIFYQWIGVSKDEKLSNDAGVRKAACLGNPDRPLF